MVYYHAAKIKNNLKDTKLFCKRVITHVNLKNACNYLLSPPILNKKTKNVLIFSQLFVPSQPICGNW